MKRDQNMFINLKEIYGGKLILGNKYSTKVIGKWIVIIDNGMTKS